MSELSLDISNEGDECKFTLVYGETKLITKFDYKVIQDGDAFTDEQIDLVREGIENFLKEVVENFAFNLYKKLKGGKQ